MRIQGKKLHITPRKSLVTSTIGTMAESTLATGMPRRAQKALKIEIRHSCMWHTNIKLLIDCTCGEVRGAIMGATRQLERVRHQRI